MAALVAAPGGTPPAPNRILVTVNHRQYELVFYQINAATHLREEIKNVNLSPAQLTQIQAFVAPAIQQLSQYLANQQAQMAQQNQQMPRITWIDENGIEFAGAQGSPPRQVAFPAAAAPMGAQVAPAWSNFAHQTLTACQTEIRAAITAMTTAAAAPAAAAAAAPALPAAAPAAAAAAPVASVLGRTLTQHYPDCRASELSLLLQDTTRTELATPITPPTTLSARAKKREAWRNEHFPLATPRAVQTLVATEKGILTYSALATKYDTDARAEDATRPRIVAGAAAAAINHAYTLIYIELIKGRKNITDCQTALEAALDAIQRAGQEQYIHEYYNAMAEARGLTLRATDFGALLTALDESYTDMLSSTALTLPANKAAYEELRDCLIEALACWSDRNGDPIIIVAPPAPAGAHPAPAAVAAAPVAAAPVGAVAAAAAAVARAPARAAAAAAAVPGAGPAGRAGRASVGVAKRIWRWMRGK